MTMDVRVATRDELATFAAWADAEGWLPGRDDLDPFHAADPQGFHVALEDGRIVATISVVRYEPAYAFLGFYIVAPDRRGEGLGHRIWAAGMDTARDRVVGLDGVAEQVPSYEECGFAFSHWTPRYQGPCADLVHGLGTEGSVVVQPIHASDALPDVAEAIEEFDGLHVPARRTAFLRSWLDPRSSRVTLAASVEGSLAGYATVRPSISGAARIGPLFAVGDAVARALLAECARVASGWTDQVCIDVPERNESAAQLVTGHGMAPAFACARMYRGPAPELPYERIYGSTTYELG